MFRLGKMIPIGHHQESDSAAMRKAGQRRSRRAAIYRFLGNPTQGGEAPPGSTLNLNQLRASLLHRSPSLFSRYPSLFRGSNFTIAQPLVINGTLTLSLEGKFREIVHNLRPLGSTSYRYRSPKVASGTMLNPSPSPLVLLTR